LGHMDDVSSVAFIEDNLLFSGGWDSRIILWNLEAGEAVKFLEGHENAIESLAISPDRQKLASFSVFGDTVLWNVATGERLYTISEECRDVTFSPDGSIIAAGSRYNGVQLWDADNGDLLYSLDSFQGVISVDFSPDGYLYVADQDPDIVYKIDPTTGETILEIGGFISTVVRAIFSSDGSQLLIAGSGSGKSFVSVTDLESGQIVFEKAGFTEEPLWDADISPDGSLIVAGIEDTGIQYIPGIPLYC